jgi:hypothetical protein
MENVVRKPKIKKFSRKAVKTSSNPKVKKIVKKLEDKSFINQIRSYKEIHSEWEDQSEPGWIGNS